LVTAEAAVGRHVSNIPGELTLQSWQEIAAQTVPDESLCGKGR
jgi:hypothetical protein